VASQENKADEQVVVMQLNSIFGEELSNKINSIKENEPTHLSKIYVRILTDDEDGSFTTLNFCKVMNIMRKEVNSQTSIS